MVLLLYENLLPNMGQLPVPLMTSQGLWFHNFFKIEHGKKVQNGLFLISGVKNEQIRCRSMLPLKLKVWLPDLGLNTCHALIIVMAERR